MKQGWKVKEFEQCIVKVKYTPKILSSDYQSEGKHPIVSQEKELISGYWDKDDDVYFVNKPVVIFGDHTKVIKYIDFDFVLGADGVKILLPEKDISSKFLYYYIQNIKLDILGYARHYKLLKNTQIRYPSFLEQERIVGILDSAFAKIEALKANAQQNLQNAKDLFQASLKQELTPKQGWKTQKLDAIADITSSKRIYKNEYVREGIPFYRTKEIKELSNGHEISLELFISTERYQEIKTKFGVPRIGDILISAVGTIGEILVIQDESEFYFKDGNIIWIKDISNTTSSFLSYNLKSIIEQLKSITIGAAYSALTIEKFKEMEISFPNSKIEQLSIVEKLDALSERCRAMEENYRQTIAHCNALKQTLLTKAFKGEL